MDDDWKIDYEIVDHQRAIVYNHLLWYNTSLYSLWQYDSFYSEVMEYENI